jgi:protein-S-isoprenylcysteine O-methyltransferase Ste14
MPYVMLIFAQMVGIATGIGFVLMMALYFRAGPQKFADRCMSITVLTGTLLQYAGFLSMTQCGVVRSIAGTAIFLLANLLFWSARIAHGIKRPAAVFGQAVPEALTQCGPYRMVRHPFYLAYVLAFLASAIVGNRWWMYLITAALFLLYNLAAGQEERLLLACPRIGQQYADYRRRSWRWCPAAW